MGGAPPLHVEQHLTDATAALRNQVSDIKRANGLLTDTAMFARPYVHIPTSQLPVGCVLGAAAWRRRRR